MDDSTPTRPTSDFETFLEKSGLTLERHDESSAFGDKLLQYASDAIRVQVKTARSEAMKNDRDVGRIYLWRTNATAAIERNERNLWYAYVWLNGWPAGETFPEVFFVPSKVVVNCMKGVLADKDTWEYFWMRVSEAQKYKGHSGLNSPLGALG